jgi:hypothetical protein
VKPKPAKAALKHLPKPKPAKVVKVNDLKQGYQGTCQHQPPCATQAVCLRRQLPVILTLSEMAAVYRISPLTIRRGLQTNGFRPLPFEKYPYRWLRDDVIRDLQTRHVKLKSRRHGFAAAKLKREAAAVSK